METLLGALAQYKQINFEKGMYKVNQDVIVACAKGKTFVFTGGSKLLCMECYCPTILTFAFFMTGVLLNMPLSGIDPMYGAPGIDAFMGAVGAGLITGGCIFAALAVLVLVTKLRSFIIAGPEGLAYRRWFAIQYFNWADIVNIHTTHYIHGISSRVTVEMQAKDGVVTTINTSQFKSKELPWSGRDLLIAQAIYAHWALKTKGIGSPAPVAGTGTPSAPGPGFGNIQDPTAPP